MCRDDRKAIEVWVDPTSRTEPGGVLLWRVKTDTQSLAFLHKLGYTLASWANSWRMSLLESLVHGLETTDDDDGGAVPCGTCKANPLRDSGGKQLGWAWPVSWPCHAMSRGLDSRLLGTRTQPELAKEEAV